MRTVLHIPYPPSANALFGTNKKTHRRFKTKPYTNWIELAGWALRTQDDRHNRHINPVSITYLIRKPDDNRVRDKANLHKAIDDLLVRHRILADDSLIHRTTSEWTFTGEPGALVIIEDIC